MSGECDKCGEHALECECETYDKKLEEAIREISFNHRKIINDWCKAYLAQLYSEGHEIKPGSFTLCEQVPTYHKGQDCMVKKYWFEKGTPRFDNDHLLT